MPPRRRHQLSCIHAVIETRLLARFAFLGVSQRPSGAVVAQQRGQWRQTPRAALSPTATLFRLSTRTHGHLFRKFELAGSLVPAHQVLARAHCLVQQSRISDGCLRDRLASSPAGPEPPAEFCLLQASAYRAQLIAAPSALTHYTVLPLSSPPGFPARLWQWSGSTIYRRHGHSMGRSATARLVSHGADRGLRSVGLAPPAARHSSQTYSFLTSSLTAARFPRPSTPGRQH